MPRETNGNAFGEYDDLYLEGRHMLHNEAFYGAFLFLDDYNMGAVRIMRHSTHRRL
jgi:hypothetical protein